VEKLALAFLDLLNPNWEPIPPHSQCSRVLDVPLIHETQSDPDFVVVLNILGRAHRTHSQKQALPEISSRQLAMDPVIEHQVAWIPVGLAREGIPYAIAAHLPGILQPFDIGVHPRGIERDVADDHFAWVVAADKYLRNVCNAAAFQFADEGIVVGPELPNGERGAISAILQTRAVFKRFQRDPGRLQVTPIL
jgi:hypothetical protein